FSDYRDGKLALEWRWGNGNQGAVVVCRNDRMPVGPTDGSVTRIMRTGESEQGTCAVSLGEGNGIVAIYAFASFGDQDYFATVVIYQARLREPCAARY